MKTSSHSSRLLRALIEWTAQFFTHKLVRLCGAVLADHCFCLFALPTCFAVSLSFVLSDIKSACSCFTKPGPTRRTFHLKLHFILHSCILHPFTLLTTPSLLMPYHLLTKPPRPLPPPLFKLGHQTLWDSTSIGLGTQACKSCPCLDEVLHPSFHLPLPPKLSTCQGKYLVPL